MTLSDVELGHHVHARAEPCLSVPGSRAYLPSSTARGRETLGAGSPTERAGIDQSQPRVCTTSGPFSPCSFPSAGSKMMQCFVCWEVTSLLHVRKQKKGAGRSRPICHLCTRTAGSAEGRPSVAARGRAARGAGIRGAAHAARQVGSYRHLGSRASGAGCPFLIRAERQMVRTGAATAPREAR